MSEIDRHIFEVYQSEDNTDHFIGNSFAVVENGQRKVITAVHVAFDGLDPRQLKLKSLETGEEIVSPKFAKRNGCIDVAEASVPGDSGLPVSVDLEQKSLRIKSSARGGYLKDDHELEAIEPTNKLQVFFKKKDAKPGESESGRHGSSGAPLLNENGEAVAVLTRGWREQGIQKGRAFRLRPHELFLDKGK